MAREKLTPGRVRNFSCQPGINCAEKAKQSFLYDTEVPRLALRATISGSKSFVFDGWFEGKGIRLGIGDSRNWTLEDARAEARRLHTLLDQGIDPRDLERDKREAKAAAKAEKLAKEQEAERRKSFTLKALCEAYCKNLKSKGKIKSSRDALSAFNCYVFETEHAERTASEITPSQIAGIVRSVFESGKERTAGILRSYLVAAYNAARRAPFDPTILSTLIDFQITTNPADPVPAIGVNRGERTLTLDELKVYLETLGDTPVDQLLKLHIYAGGQRMIQISRAKVRDYTTDTGTLRLWDNKGKRRAAREHLIPLAANGKAIMKALAAGKAQDAKLFVSERAAGNRIAEIRKEMKAPYFDARDLRRTCETILAGMGITKETRAHLLSHGLGGVQDAVYDKHAYTKEKRTALEAWEAKLAQIIEGTAENRKNITRITKTLP